MYRLEHLEWHDPATERFTYAEARGGPTEAVTIAGIREAVEVGRDSLELVRPPIAQRHQAGMDEYNDAEEDPLTSR